jgi:hypothetical protein
MILDDGCVDEKKKVCPVRRSGNSRCRADRVGFLGTCGALTVDGGLRPVLYHGLRVEREKGYLSRN